MSHCILTRSYIHSCDVMWLNHPCLSIIGIIDVYIRFVIYIQIDALADVAEDCTKYKGRITGTCSPPDRYRSKKGYLYLRGYRMYSTSIIASRPGSLSGPPHILKFFAGYTVLWLLDNICLSGLFPLPGFLRVMLHRLYILTILLTHSKLVLVFLRRASHSFTACHFARLVRPTIKSVSLLSKHL